MKAGEEGFEPSTGVSPSLAVCMLVPLGTDNGLVLDAAAVVFESIIELLLPPKLIETRVLGNRTKKNSRTSHQSDQNKVLCQLSYWPFGLPNCNGESARKDSNPQPLH